MFSKFQNIAIITLLLLTACSKDQNSAPENYNLYDYFPLENNRFWIYQCDSIVHTDADDNNVPATDSTILFSYELKEQIDSSFIDGEGTLSYRISRYKRLSDSLPWQFINIWVAKLNLQNAERVEDNYRFIKLSFPIKLNSIWNGNAKNILQPEEYRYESIHLPIEINNLSFDSSVAVIQNDFSSIINRIYKKEIYAFKTGMIFKQADSLTLRSFTGQVTILNGFEYRQSLLSFGF